MRPLRRIIKVTQAFARKDWIEFNRPIIGMTGGLMVPVLMLLFDTRRVDLAKGMVAGILLGAPFVYAQSCFYLERQHGTLDFLLSLPLTRFELVLAKFGSLYSMTVFTIALPSLVLRDLELLVLGSIIAIFLSTVFMCSTVISDKPWAPQLPMWLVILLTLPLRGKLGGFLAYLNPALLLVLAVVAIPVMVVGSALLFARKG